MDGFGTSQIPVPDVRGVIPVDEFVRRKMALEALAAQGAGILGQGLGAFGKMVGREVFGDSSIFGARERQAASDISRMDEAKAEAERTRLLSEVRRLHPGLSDDQLNVKVAELMTAGPRAQAAQADLTSAQAGITEIERGVIEALKGGRITAEEAGNRLRAATAESAMRRLPSEEAAAVATAGGQVEAAPYMGPAAAAGVAATQQGTKESAARTQGVEIETEVRKLDLQSRRELVDAEIRARKAELEVLVKKTVVEGKRTDVLLEKAEELVRLELDNLWADLETKNANIKKLRTETTQADDYLKLAQRRLDNEIEEARMRGKQLSASALSGFVGAVLEGAKVASSFGAQQAETLETLDGHLSRLQKARKDSTGLSKMEVQTLDRQISELMGMRDKVAAQIKTVPPQVFEAYLDNYGIAMRALLAGTME